MADFIEYGTLFAERSSLLKRKMGSVDKIQNSVDRMESFLNTI